MLIDCKKLGKSIQIISNELKNHNEECDTISIHYDRANNFIVIRVYYRDIMNALVVPTHITTNGFQVSIDYLIRTLIKYEAE